MKTFSYLSIRFVFRQKKQRCRKVCETHETLERGSGPPGPIYSTVLYFILHSLLGQPRRVRATLPGSVNKAARIFHLPFITHLCEHRNLTVVCSNIIRAALGGVHWRHLPNFLRDSFVCIYRVSPKFRTFSKNSWHS